MLHARLIPTLALALLAPACAEHGDLDGGEFSDDGGKSDGDRYGGQVGIYGPIAFGEARSFTFTGSRVSPAFRFNAKRGDVVTSIGAISNNAPPWLLIIDEGMNIYGNSGLGGLFDLEDGRQATQVSAEIPRDGEYFLVMSSTWTRNRVAGQTITVDLDRETGGGTCQPVTCELYCGDRGFDTDANGCEVCRCKREVDCQPVTCELHCGDRGFDTDANGCEVCRCAD